MPAIRFFSKQTEFALAHPRKTTRWIGQVFEQEGQDPGEISIIFCSDQYLLSINQTYLNHNNYTDVITFSYEEKGQPIAGDIFISLDRVKENAARFHASPDHELHRVMIHGVLHLLGYTDKTKRQRALMRKREDAYLSLR